MPGYGCLKVAASAAERPEAMAAVVTAVADQRGQPEGEGGPAGGAFRLKTASENRKLKRKRTASQGKRQHEKV